MPKSKHTYEYIKEDKKDVLQSKIVKKNVEVEFTMQQLLDQEENLDKYRREIVAKIENDKAVQSNVEEYHNDAVELVRNLDPIKQNAIFLWLRSQQSLDTHEPKLVEVDKVFEEHNKEVEEIKKQTGWVAPDIKIDPKVKRKNDKEPEKSTKEKS